MHTFSCLRVFSKKTLLFYSVRSAKFSYRTPSRAFRTRRPIIKDEGMRVAPIKEIYETPRENHMLPGLWKSFVFTAGFCGACYVGATICQYENARKPPDFSSWVKDRWNRGEGWTQKEGGLRQQMNRWWNSVPPGEKTYWYIFAANALVFLCWQHPALKPFMLRYFASTPASRAVCWPLTLCTFSHYSLIHFGMNMFVLHSFFGAMGHTLGTEQAVGLYLAGGVVSSLASHACKVITGNIGPSLGASGAILAMLGFFCMRYPDAQLGIVFIPGFTFRAHNAIKVVMALDFLGIILRWRLFDHAAHLGGALFGVAYQSYGGILWEKRPVVIRKWRKFKQSFIDNRGR